MMDQEAEMEADLEGGVGSEDSDSNDSTNSTDQPSTYRRVLRSATNGSATEPAAKPGPQFVNFDPADEFPTYTYEPTQQNKPCDLNPQPIGYNPDDSSSQPIAYDPNDPSAQPIAYDPNDTSSQPIVYDSSGQPITYNPNDPSAQPTVYDSSSNTLAHDSSQPIAYEPGDSSVQPIAYDPSAQPIDYDPSAQPIAYDTSAQPIAYDPSTQPVAYDSGAQPVAYDSTISSGEDDSGDYVAQSDAVVEAARVTVMDHSEFEQYPNTPSDTEPASHSDHSVPTCSEYAPTPQSTMNLATAQPTLTPDENSTVTPDESECPAVTPDDYYPMEAPDEYPTVTPDDYPAVTPDNYPTVTQDSYPAGALEDYPVVALDDYPAMTADDDPIVTLEEYPTLTAEECRALTPDLEQDVGRPSPTEVPSMCSVTKPRGPSILVTTTSGPHKEIVPGAAPSTGIFKNWLLNAFGGESIVDVLPTLSRISGRSEELIKEATRPEVVDSDATADTSSGQPKKQEDAISYVNTIKATYSSHPQTFNRFLCLLRDFKMNKISLDNVMREIKELFKDNPHLIAGFDQFLPAAKRKESAEVLDGDKATPADMFCMLFYGHRSPALPLLVPPLPEFVNYRYTDIENSYATRSRSVWEEDEDLNMTCSEMESESEVDSQSEYEEDYAKYRPGHVSKYSKFGFALGQPRESSGMHAASRLTNKAKRMKIDEKRVKQYEKEHGVSYEEARKMEINRVFLAKRLQQHDPSNTDHESSDTNDSNYTDGGKKSRGGRGKGRGRGRKPKLEQFGASDDDQMSKREISRLKSIEYRRSAHGIETNRKYALVRRKRMIEKRAKAYAEKHHIPFEKAEQIVNEQVEATDQKKQAIMENKLKEYVKKHNVTYEEAKQAQEDLKEKAKERKLQKNAERDRIIKERTKQYVRETGLRYDEARDVIVSQLTVERQNRGSFYQRRVHRGGRRHKESSSEGEEDGDVEQSRVQKKGDSRHQRNGRHLRRCQDVEEGGISSEGAQKGKDEEEKQKGLQCGNHPKHSSEKLSSSESETIEVDEQPSAAGSNQIEQIPKNVRRPSRIQGALSLKLMGHLIRNYDAQNNKNGIPLIRTQDGSDSRMTSTQILRKSIFEAVRQHQIYRKQIADKKEASALSSFTGAPEDKKTIPQNEQGITLGADPVRSKATRDHSERVESSKDEQAAVTKKQNPRKASSGSNAEDHSDEADSAKDEQAIVTKNQSPMKYSADSDARDHSDKAHSPKDEQAIVTKKTSLRKPSSGNDARDDSVQADSSKDEQATVTKKQSPRKPSSSDARDHLDKADSTNGEQATVTKMQSPRKPSADSNARDDSDKADSTNDEQATVTKFQSPRKPSADSDARDDSDKADSTNDEQATITKFQNPRKPSSDSNARDNSDKADSSKDVTKHQSHSEPSSDSEMTIIEKEKGCCKRKREVGPDTGDNLSSESELKIAKKPPKKRRNSFNSRSMKTKNDKGDYGSKKKVKPQDTGNQRRSSESVPETVQTHHDKHRYSLNHKFAIAERNKGQGVSEKSLEIQPTGKKHSKKHKHMLYRNATTVENDKACANENTIATLDIRGCGNSSERQQQTVKKRGKKDHGGSSEREPETVQLHRKRHRHGSYSKRTKTEYDTGYHNKAAAESQETAHALETIEQRATADEHQAGKINQSSSEDEHQTAKRKCTRYKQPNIMFENVDAPCIVTTLNAKAPTLPQKLDPYEVVGETNQVDKVSADIVTMVANVKVPTQPKNLYPSEGVNDNNLVGEGCTDIAAMTPNVTVPSLPQILDATKGVSDNNLAAVCNDIITMTPDVKIPIQALDASKVARDNDLVGEVCAGIVTMMPNVKVPTQRHQLDASEVVSNDNLVDKVPADIVTMTANVDVPIQPQELDAFGLLGDDNLVDEFCADLATTMPNAKVPIQPENLDAPMAISDNLGSEVCANIVTTMPNAKVTTQPENLDASTAMSDNNLVGEVCADIVTMMPNVKVRTQPQELDVSEVVGNANMVDKVPADIVTMTTNVMVPKQPQALNATEVVGNDNLVAMVASDVVTMTTNVKVPTQPQELDASELLDDNLIDKVCGNIVTNYELDHHSISLHKREETKAKKRCKAQHQQQIVIHETVTSDVPYVRTLDASNPPTNVISLDKVTIEEFHLKVLQSDNTQNIFLQVTSQLQVGPHYECFGIVKTSNDMAEPRRSGIGALCTEQKTSHGSLRDFRWKAIKQVPDKLVIPDTDIERDVITNDDHDNELDIPNTDIGREVITNDDYDELDFPDTDLESDLSIDDYIPDTDEDTEFSSNDDHYDGDDKYEYNGISFNVTHKYNLDNEAGMGRNIESLAGVSHRHHQSSALSKGSQSEGNCSNGNSGKGKTYKQDTTKHKICGDVLGLPQAKSPKPLDDYEVPDIPLVQVSRPSAVRKETPSFLQAFTNFLQGHKSEAPLWELKDEEKQQDLTLKVYKRNKKTS